MNTHLSIVHRYQSLVSIFKQKSSPFSVEKSTMDYKYRPYIPDSITNAQLLINILRSFWSGFIVASAIIAYSRPGFYRNKTGILFAACSSILLVSSPMSFIWDQNGWTNCYARVMYLFVMSYLASFCYDFFQSLSAMHSTKIRWFKEWFLFCLLSK
jgi:NADH:ubiquinone oxidoreductase subunit K